MTTQNIVTRLEGKPDGVYIEFTRKLVNDFDDNTPPDGVYIEFTRKLVNDFDDNTPPDQRDDGFWPSLDRNEVGFIGDGVTLEEFAKQEAAANKRMEGFEQGYWNWCGVRAVATIYHKCNRTITQYSVESAGVWGVESDAPDAHLNELFTDQQSELEQLFTTMQSGITFLK